MFVGQELTEISQGQNCLLYMLLEGKIARRRVLGDNNSARRLKVKTNLYYLSHFTNNCQ